MFYFLKIEVYSLYWLTNHGMISLEFKYGNFINEELSAFELISGESKY